MTVEGIVVSVLLVMAQLSPTVQDKEWDESQVACLAENIYHEARSEPVREQAAIAQVTLNRVRNGKYPDTICGVVHQPSQFSWTLDQSNDVDLDNVVERKAFVNAVEVAVLTMSGLLDDYTEGSTHYLNKDKLDKLPRWARDFKEIGKLDSHTFYKEVNNVSR